MLEIAAFTGALSSLGALIKVANESKNVPMTDKLIELQQKIIEMQGDFGEMQQKLFDLQQKNRELTESSSRRTQYEHRFNVVWRKENDGTYVGPFCPICKSNGKEVPLKSKGGDATASGISMTCQTFHQEPTAGNMARPTYYNIPKEAIPKDWLYTK